MLVIRNRVLFPGGLLRLSVGKPRSVRLVEVRLDEPVSIVIEALPQRIYDAEDSRVLKPPGSYGGVIVAQAIMAQVLMCEKA